jgi:hypothetical protein
MIKKYITTGLLYTAGSLTWIIIFFSLKAWCVVDIPLLADGLWTTRINDQLVKNLTNSIAFRTQNMNCDDKYIFTAKYYQEGVSGNFETRPLTSIVDIPSWKELESDSISTTYVDIRHKYVVYNTSDGIYMRVFDHE